MMKFLTIATLWLIAATLPRAAAAQPRATSLPAPTTTDDLEALAEQTRPAVYPLRSQSDLGRHYRPRFIESDGVAVAVEFADGTVTLVSAYAHLASATEIEVYADGEWRAATVHHATGMFDLAGLTVAGFEPEATIPLSPDHELTPTLYTIGPVQPNEEAGLHITTFGDPPEEPWNYYARNVLLFTNGYPIINSRGHLVGIASVHAPDRRRNPGVFTVPSAMIEVWYDEWPQLETDSPIGWSPRQRIETVEPTTGRDVLGD